MKTQFTKPGGAATDIGVQGVTDDVEEQQWIWSRIANLITVRSDTFAAYILIQEVNREGTVVNRRREVVLFDRSLCNQPPLEWKPADNKWIANPNYRAPRVVARQVVE